MREPCRNTSLTLARPLTEEDYTNLEGIIMTPLGPEHFSIGDFLSRSHAGSWVITHQCMEERYCLVCGSRGGWAIYKLKDPVSTYAR